eukprot:COSAG01_NODE_11412_length_1940_cov_1.611081_1_plen_91_part_10
MCKKTTQKTGGAAHLSSGPTLLLPKDAPPADFPFDAAGSPDATRGATPAPRMQCSTKRREKPRVDAEAAVPEAGPWHPVNIPVPLARLRHP